MSRRAAFSLIVVAATVTAAMVSYAVLRLPEPGESRQSAVAFPQWAEQRSLQRESLAAQCATVNETEVDRKWCFGRLIEEARRAWRRSQAGMTEVWIAADLSAKRELYTAVGVYVLFAFTVGLLTVRTVARLV